MGKLLDPFHGFWQNAETNATPVDETLSFPELHDQVTIKYDDRGVPHIFAGSDYDLYFAQGFVVARDRLWQMEFLTHLAAGRLSEIFGERTFELDKYQRRIGLTYGAQNTLKEMQSDSVQTLLTSAYTAGVNSYIATLTPDDYPLEYKILDYAPEPWSPLKCALLLKYMSWNLSGYNSDLRMSNTLAKFGKEVVTDLFPNSPGRMDPVIPNGTRWPFKPVPVKAPEKEFQPSVSRPLLPRQPNPANGSNNWAVSGSKTTSGFPLLANDPHLELNLPSIWYEIQMTAPGVNVYGVTLPGSPSVIIGFNEAVAWGVTNSGADVIDWYEIKFKDDSYSQYWYDGAWKASTRVIEKIEIRGQAAVNDTIVFTHHGPVSQLPGESALRANVPAGHALRWLGHDATPEARCYYYLNRAQNYDEYVNAIASYHCPAQNFVFAAGDGDIAIWHNGKFPARWREQGKYVLDGSDPLHDWQAWLPHEHNPHMKNPQRGFVSSANQNPAAPDYPYYLGWNFEPYYRGARINEWLASSSRMDPNDFRILQLDTKNLHAESVLPALLRLLEPDKLTSAQNAILQRLTKWDYFNDADKAGPTIFTRWWALLYHAIWDDEFSGYLRVPHKDRTVQLILEDPQSQWFDQKQSETTESLADLAKSTFAGACSELETELGLLGDDWHWGSYRGTDIVHLGRIPGMGILNLDLGGDLGIVNATGKTHGPSWRMVVALGPEVEAWGIYPGGQSGNPGSPRYDEFVEQWAAGELAELLFLKSADDERAQAASRLTLSPR